MADEDKYVLRYEWERGQGKLHQRINDIDNKHMSLHNDLQRRTHQKPNDN